jgi:hypothetical protein
VSGAMAILAVNFLYRQVNNVYSKVNDVYQPGGSLGGDQRTRFQPSILFLKSLKGI